MYNLTIGIDIQGNKNNKKTLYSYFIIPHLKTIKTIFNVILHTSTQRTAPSILTTFNTYTCDVIARGISFTISATFVHTLISKIASGTHYGKISKLLGICDVNLSFIKH